MTKLSEALQKHCLAMLLIFCSAGWASRSFAGDSATMGNITTDIEAIHGMRESLVNSVQGTVSKGQY